MATLIAVLVSGTLWVSRDDAHDDGAGAGPAAAPPTHTPGPTPRPPTTPASEGDVGAEIARLRALSPPDRVADSGARRMPSGHRHQPDLYARAFVERLLTQDYTTPREEHLAWVQQESARTDEPLVTGLVPPELRDRVALFSVTGQGPGPSPIPPPAEWESLRAQRARTTVAVQRVTEPLVWSNAVEAGRISDPGVTAREVTALVTLHTVTDGRPTTSRTSVALTLNLTGPPTRDTWAFVAVVTFRAVPMGAS